MWARFVNTIPGIWLMAAPAVMGYGNSAAATNHRIIGPLVISAAVIAIWEETRPVRWVNLPLGLWLTISPLFISYPSVVTTMTVLVGLIIATCSLVQGTYRPETFGGGWAALWK